MSRSWGLNDYDILRKEYPLSGREVMKHFEGSTFDTVRSRALRVNASAFIPFTEQELKLAKAYGPSLGSALIFLIPDRTPSEIALLLQ